MLLCTLQSNKTKFSATKQWEGEIKSLCEIGGETGDTVYSQSPD